MNPATARYLDGPRFVEWLKAEGITEANMTETEARKCGDWKRGIRADVMSPTVDGMLTRYGMPTTALPDHLFAENQSHRTGKGKRRRSKKSVPPATVTLWQRQNDSERSGKVAA